MRWYLLAAAVLVSGAGAASAAPQPVADMPVVNPNSPSSAQCPPISRYEAMKRGEKLGLKNLGELPGADMYKAVYRKVGGCVAPIIVGYGFGNPRDSRPAR
jgi:hypothetical protein